MRDLIVIGGGIAGVSSALYAKSRGLDVLVIERDKIGGLIRGASKVTHFASLVVAETGEEFSKRLESQLEDMNIEVAYENVEDLKKSDDLFIIKTDKNSYEAKKIVVASGSTPKELSVDNKGHKFYHYGNGAEDLVKNKTVIVNGGSDGACKEAIYLSKFAKEVHIVQIMDRLMTIDEFKSIIESSDNIIVHTSSELLDIKDEEGIITSVNLTDGEISDSDGIEIFVSIGQSGNSEFLDDNFEITDGFVKTEVISDIDGLYFAGDIRVKPVRQLATAVSDGCIAGIEAAK